MLYFSPTANSPDLLLFIHEKLKNRWQAKFDAYKAPRSATTIQASKMTTRRILRSSGQDPNKAPDKSRTVVSEVLRPVCIEYKPNDAVDLRAVKLIADDDRLPHIDTEELAILRAKQAKLRRTRQAVVEKLTPSSHFQSSLASTLIFAQHEAGTAVCVRSTGDVLSCAHCFGESELEWRQNKFKWLLYYTGEAVLVECYKWDPRRDLALARIVAIEVRRIGLPALSSLTPVFSAMRPSKAGHPRLDTPIFCIGQPGQDDLESSTARKTKYDLFEVSEGHYRGMISGADPHDCSEIGSLKHDAWTYWGHSGAPLIRIDNGELVGLHSSWDDQTAMRHGIPAVAISEFLKASLENIDLTED